MRTSLWIALSVLTLMICGGMAADKTVKIQSERYVSAAEEIRVLAEDAQWDRAREITSAYRQKWEKTVPWLQMIIDHEDIDCVTMALEQLEVSTRLQEKLHCMSSCAKLREHAEHLHHRDAFVWSNIL